jgi:NSS family neurotransmitter:Na+ symporter
VAKERDHWGSNLGFVLAAAGSAVGLGNLWKFPYITWDNGGGGFVLIYLACILLVGLPIMISEVFIGRYTQESPVPAFEILGEKATGGKAWSIVGWMGVACGVLILSFYIVIAGWSISYFVQCLDWSFNGYQPPEEGSFGRFVGDGGTQAGLAMAFLAATAVIVSRGISGGIEKATKVLMPVLFVILIYLVITSITLDGFGDAMAFLFTPDFSKLTGHGVIEALGHAFFTLSLGMGAMITYGSYMQPGKSILKASLSITILDTLIAMVACTIMFSIIFTSPTVQAFVESEGGDSSVGMLFLTLPPVFYEQMSGGAILGPVFFILVGFAALSSTISLLEVPVAMVIDKMGYSRTKATLIICGVVGFLGLLCSQSLGAMNWATTFNPFGYPKEGFLDVFDIFTSSLLLPLGGLGISVFVGWFVKPEVLGQELHMVDANGRPNTFALALHWCLRTIAPISILIVFIASNFLKH